MDNLNIEPLPFLWVEEGKEEVYTPRMRRRNKKKKEFVGWGSRQLIAFLDSVGRETSKAISQHDIAELIYRYVSENRLINPEKKKRVICDERLHALFGRKTISRVKIYDLLEAHLAENQDNSDNDLLSSSEDESVSKRQRAASSDRKTQYKKKVPEVPKTSPAAISSENMKLVYLKRTLVQELLKQPETFEVKVLGSFVRIKSDPLDIFQKNSHQLQLVKGVKALAAAGDNSSSTLLLVSGLTHEISISELSDDNFSEEECEDLLKRMKDGLIKQPTVGELEQKVMILHEDITRHWLTRELALLKNRIDRANEKGWRHRVTEYLDKRRLLQTPSEQSRLLSEIPQVTAEKEKTETVLEEPAASGSQNDDDSPKAVDWDWDWELCYDSRAKDTVTMVSSKQTDEGEVENEPRSNTRVQFSSPEERDSPKAEATKSESNGHGISFEQKERHIPERQATGHMISFEQKERHIPEREAIGSEINGNGNSLNSDHRNFSLTLETKEKANGPLQPQISKEQDHFHMKMENLRSKQMQVVIDLSDDDDEEQEVPCNRKQIPIPSPSPSSRFNPTIRSPSPSPRLNPTIPSPRLNPTIPSPSPSLSPRLNPNPRPNPSPLPLTEQLMWYYFDPKGNVQGPFSLASLKRWRDASFFPADFRVWRTAQNPHEAVLLNDLLRQILPN